MTETYESILQEIRELKTMLAMPDRLWGIEDIAMYTGLSQSHVRDVVVAHPTFPRPAEMPGKGEKRKPRRWTPTEVRDWVEGRKNV